MKRLFTFLLVALMFALFAPARPASAQAESWKFEPPTSFGRAISGNNQNAQSSSFTFLQYDAYGITCMIGGFACSENLADSGAFFQKSALGYLSGGIAMTYNAKPAGFAVWLADTGQSLGFLPKPAYAQGVGFSGMLPLLPIWKVFRNVAYLLLAVVMMAIGFMIMFRKKIDPKTVVTAQNAIPRVVIALILITFSYAIVGLVIDLMYVVIALIVVIFKATNYLPDAQEALATGHLFKSLFMTEFNPLKILFDWNWDASVVGGGGFLVALVTLIVGFVPGMQWLWVGTLATAVVPLIFYVALLFLYIRLFAFFLMTYIQIILSLLLSPLQFLFESFPGSTAFSSWFKNLLANIAVFPVAAAMFMLSAIFQAVSKSQVPTWTVDTTPIWSPPYVGFSPTTSAITSLISLGILFAIPQVCGSIKEALKAKPVVGMGGGGGTGSTMQWLSSAYYMRSFIPQNIIDRVMGKSGESGHNK